MPKDNSPATLSGALGPINPAWQGNDSTDARLLDRFVEHWDQAAFRELVSRHGPMVLGVCNRILRATHAAEDAFQATFWVLARKAGSVRKRESVGSWLFGVARRVALEARGRGSGFRSAVSVEPEARTVNEPPDIERDELLAILH